MIISLALVLVIGTLSAGALNSTLTKRNTAVEAVIQYEMDSVGAGAYDGSAAPYSDCFATESPTSPTAAPGYRAACPAPFTLRSDVTWAALPSQAGVQVWTISVWSVADGIQIGRPISIYKVSHQ